MQLDNEMMDQTVALTERAYMKKYGELGTGMFFKAFMTSFGGKDQLRETSIRLLERAYIETDLTLDEIKAEGYNPIILHTIRRRIATQFEPWCSTKMICLSA